MEEFEAEYDEFTMYRKLKEITGMYQRIISMTLVDDKNKPTIETQEILDNMKSIYLKTL